MKTRKFGGMNLRRDRKEEPGPAVFVDVVIQLRVPQDLSLEERKGQQHNCRKGLQAHHDLLPHLVLQKPRVLHHSVVENEIVREGREEEIQ